MMDWPALEREMTFIFMAWSDDHTEEIFADWGDSKAALIVEQQAAYLLRDLDGSDLMRKRTNLQLRIQRLAQPQPPGMPHRPVNRQPANRPERELRDAEVPGHFSKQVKWREEQLGISFVQQPRTDGMVPLLKGITEKPLFLVIHLFSGRRRDEDFHAHLQRLCQEAPFQLKVLSMDTAVSIEQGDLRCSGKPWSFLRWQHA